MVSPQSSVTGLRASGLCGAVVQGVFWRGGHAGGFGPKAARTALAAQPPADLPGQCAGPVCVTAWARRGYQLPIDLSNPGEKVRVLNLKPPFFSQRSADLRGPPAAPGGLAGGWRDWGQDTEMLAAGRFFANGAARQGCGMHLRNKSDRG